ncbi:MAG: hypothetical protein QF371_05680, partial [Flavobacteriales bacterium]|nr:hypothetical protein [Flavobacteriales bacterium]
TQSFGRITGENSWRNDTTVLFFGHVFLWSFIPWTLVAIAALFHEIRNIRNSIQNRPSELYLISGIVMVSLALSLSKFKLPHYIFVVYPLIAILSAKYIQHLKNHSTWAWIQLVLSISAASVLIILLLYCFPSGGYVLPLFLFFLMIVSVIFMFKSISSEQVVIPSFLLSVGIGLALNLHFYKELLQYQANSMVGKWITEKKIDHDGFICFSTGGHSVDFYAQRITPWKTNAENTIAALKPGIIVYASQDRYDDMIRYGAAPDSVTMFPNFRVQTLTMEFLNPATRDDAVKNNYLLFY